MTFTEGDLLPAYQLLLWLAAITTLILGLHQARKWAARYRKLPRIFQKAVKKGIYAAAKRFVREEWLGLTALGFLLILLAGLTIAIRMI